MIITIELSEDVGRLLAEMADREGKTVELLAIELIEKALNPEKTLDEILAPVRQSFAESGTSEVEWDVMIEEASEEVSQERRCKLNQVDKMEVRLTRDEARIVEHAITWPLYVPFGRSSSPIFSSEDIEKLQVIFNSLLRSRASESSWVAVSRTQLRGPEEVFTTDETVIRNVITCVQAFYSDIGHSPTEIAAVTGLPKSLLESLVCRLSILYQERNCDECFYVTPV